jgi:sarcosine oxidase subunit beta
LTDPVAPAPAPALPDRAELVVVGGGVIGLAIAYNCARRGLTDVVVLDRSYLAAGASGRNGGGVRQQWSTELNVRLMRESVELCRDFATELGVNVWFRQGGYLFLSRFPRETERLEKNVRLQNRLGVPTEMLTSAEARDIVPELEPAGFHAACYNPTDGVLFPWPFLWGYAQAATKLGVRIFTHTAVTAIDVDGDGFVVRTPRGAVRARRVLNAAGAWSPEVARLVGVALPDYPIRHEICSSEPLKPFLKPMVSILGSGLYFSQSMRGEIVGGVTLRDHEPTLAMGSRLRFLATYARQVTRIMPILGDIKILRAWAGPYDITEDGNPILGEADGCPGFFLCCGFMGHGFMMAPIIGRLYAELLTGGARHEIFERWTLDRFSRPGGVEKEDFIIG